MMYIGLYYSANYRMMKGENQINMIRFLAHLGNLRHMANRVHLGGRVFTKVFALINQDFASLPGCKHIEPPYKRQQDLKSVLIY